MRALVFALGVVGVVADLTIELGIAIAQVIRPARPRAGAGDVVEEYSDHMRRTVG